MLRKKVVENRNRKKNGTPKNAFEGIEKTFLFFTKDMFFCLSNNHNYVAGNISVDFPFFE